MHPVLRLDNLKRLPPSMRRVAQACCGSNHSVHELRRLRMYMATATEEQEQTICLLPVFYANLDPTWIPGDDQFDTDAPPPEAESFIGRALTSLEALYVTQFPVEIGPDIWPRAWAWDNFLYMYRDHLPGFPPQSERIFCLEFLMFAGSEEARSRVHRSAKLYVNKKIAEPQTLAEIVDGAGGTLRDVARLIVLYLRGVVHDPNISLDSLGVNFLTGLLDFVTMVDPALADPESISKTLGTLGTRLLFSGVVPALSNAVCALSTATGSQTTYALHKSCLIPGIIFTTSPGYRWIPDAIEHQFIRGLVTCAQRPVPRALQHHFLFLFLNVLSPALIYQQVVIALDSFLPDINDLIITDAFRKSEAYDPWNKLIAVFEERLDVLDSYESPEHFPLRACDNMKCAKISAKVGFKRYGGCLSFYYCCKNCQTLDWREGGHRKTCAAYGTLYLSGDMGVIL
ncbi:hypothetical protein C8R44DRAFT_889333 [Mycena epipterygia]|nr:hypothetical protein C8R44DRAFT_889333 [Mycena epipterygia]